MCESIDSRMKHQIETMLVMIVIIHIKADVMQNRTHGKEFAELCPKFMNVFQLIKQG